MEQHTKELYERLQTLTILRPLLQEPLLQSFSTMMESMLSLAEGSPASLAGMFLSPGFLLTATALGLVIWRTPQKPENETEEENHE